MPSQSSSQLNIRSIGVVMLGLMGDVIMRTPILRELRKAFPKAHITCIVDPIGKEVLQLSDLVDDLICTNRKTKRIRYLAEKIKLQAKVINRRFDFLVDLYGGSSSRNLVKLSAAKNWLIVQDFNVESKVAWKERYPVPPPKNPFHLVNGAFEILRFLDYANRSTDPTPDLNESSWDSVRSKNKAAKQPNYIITLGSGDPRKFIGQDSLAELCKWLFSEQQLTPVILRNPGQENLQENLSKSLTKLAIHHKNLDVLSLKALRNELSNVHFMVSPDTGLFHFALALKVPVLGIFSYTSPKLVTPDHGIFEFCFQEDSNSTVKVDGLPVGTQKLKPQVLISSCESLLKRIESHK